MFHHDYLFLRYPSLWKPAVTGRRERGRYRNEGRKRRKRARQLEDGKREDIMLVAGEDFTLFERKT